MIAISRLAKAAVLACMAAAICSMAPPAATAVAVQAKVTSAVAQVPAVPTPSAGVLTGTVRALGGPGLAGICVTATAPTGGTEVVSQAGGRYVLSGLRPETYRVDFRDCGQPGRYAEQWYGGALTAGAGQSVLVAPGHPTFLSPVTLRPVSGTAFVAASARAIRSKLRAEGRPSSGQAPQLSGTVTSAVGQRLAGICVTAVQVHSGDQSLEFGIGTGKNGTYQFPAGSFDNGTSWKVSFSIG